MPKEFLDKELKNVTGGTGDEEFGNHKYAVGTIITGYDQGSYRIEILELLNGGRYKVLHIHEKYARTEKVRYMNDEGIQMILSVSYSVNIR